MAKTPRRQRATRPGRLRIVAGKWRRRLLPVTALPGLRPTAERVRETLFNWLEPRIEGARCLDACAGTGALGFEALSRGARSVTLLDAHAPALRTLREAPATLGAADAEIVQADAVDWLARESPRAYDVVFLDPPYRDRLLDDLCRLLAERNWLADDARVYLELGRNDPQPALPAGWQVLKDRQAGQVRYLLVAAG